jgi:hypothetical protein
LKMTNDTERHLIREPEENVEKNRLSIQMTHRLCRYTDNMV